MSPAETLDYQKLPQSQKDNIAAALEHFMFQYYARDPYDERLEGDPNVRLRFRPWEGRACDLVLRRGNRFTLAEAKGEQDIGTGVRHRSGIAGLIGAGWHPARRLATAAVRCKRGSWPIDNRPQLAKLPHKGAHGLAYTYAQIQAAFADESRRRPLLCRAPPPVTPQLMAGIMDMMDALTRICILMLAAVAAFAGGKPQVAYIALQVPGIYPDGRTGTVDFINLFNPAAPWTTAASRIQVFKFPNTFSGNIPGSPSDAQWQQVFADLARRGIALAIEWGPLSVTTPGTGCGVGVEGFEGNTALTIAQKIQRLGGTLQFLAMDEPFYGANIYNGPNACHWTPQQIAANAAQSIAQVRTVFPNVIVGDIEPTPSPGTPDWLQRYTEWVDAWKLASGVPLAFFHCDVHWETARWIDDVESLRKVLVARGIDFGMIYNGVGKITDADWMSAAESHFIDYELHGGAIPDHVIFQTWEDHPTHALPETDPNALTYLVNRYFRQRTSLSLTSSPNRASGKLQNTQGSPIPSVPLAIALQPVSGPGIVATFTLTGKVPAAATQVTQALIQICVNQCQSQGLNDMNVYSYRYLDSGTNATQDFSKGLAGWGVQGLPERTASVQLVSDSTGPSLLIQATATQQTFVNSSSFTVTPGSTFTLTVQARISPASKGSGLFALIFLVGGKEVAVVPRATLPFTTGTISLGSVQTLSDGSYSLGYPSPPAGVFELQVSFAGSDTLWPAFAGAPLDYTPSIKASGIVNAANFQAEPLSPGAWFTVFGQNLGAAGQWSSPNTTVLGGASVSVCGLPATMSYNSGPLTANGAVGWQINALMPDAVAGQKSCSVEVTVNGTASQPATVTVAGGVMELFRFTYQSEVLPIVTHADYSLVGPAGAGLVPAKPGETVVAWGTGDCAMPNLTLAGRAVPVSFAGRVGLGLCQINFAVPNGLTGGTELAFSTSPNHYTLWVSQ